MSAFVAQPAQRQAIDLLLGVAGGTGSGKTYSALRLASGLSGGDRFVLIDTEHGRALQYADDFAFDHVAFDPPFSPSRYLEAVRAQVAAGYRTIVVDSGSHEWNGEGGVLDMADAEFERMGSREAVRMAMWIAPKREHKAFVRELVRLPAHVILCLRAEPKVEMRKGDGGRWEVVPKRTLPGAGLDGWIPVCDSMLPFECTLSFLLMADAPGVPKPMKLPGALRSLVPLDAPLTEDVGRALATWAAGTETPAPRNPHPPAAAPEHNLAEPLQELWEALPPTRLPSFEQLAAKVGRTEAASSYGAFVASLSQQEAEQLFEALSAYQAKLSEGGTADA